MPHIHQSRLTILLPLSVMLLLTLLTGFTSFQLTRTWEEAVTDVTENLTQSLILNNIRGNLRQARQALETDPAHARQLWEEARKQTELLSFNSGESNITVLRAYLGNEQNIRHIERLIEDPTIFDADPIAIQQKLRDLQAYSRAVTVNTTLCLVLLGLILMAITARDLWRMVNALIRSRDMGIALQEEERRRIAQELHDGVIQEMISLKRDYRPEKVDMLVDTIRRICHNLKPQVLEDIGLAAALELLADDLREAGTRAVLVSLDEDGLRQLPKAYELSLFRVVQELFSNIRQHAGAGQVSLTVVYNPAESPQLRLYVRDNGCGFDPGTARKGMGLEGIRERIRNLGGRIKIESEPGRGCQVQCVIPVSGRGEQIGEAVPS